MLTQTSKKTPSHFAHRSLEPDQSPIGRGSSYLFKVFIKTKMPKRGLEPLRITPYAPETHVSTIPPLRHNQISYFLFNFQPVLCTQWRMLTQGQPSRKTLNGSAFPAAEYHFCINIFYYKDKFYTKYNNKYPP